MQHAAQFWSFLAGVQVVDACIEHASGANMLAGPAEPA